VWLLLETGFRTCRQLCCCSVAHRRPQRDRLVGPWPWLCRLRGQSVVMALLFCSFCLHTILFTLWLLETVIPEGVFARPSLAVKTLLVAQTFKYTTNYLFQLCLSGSYGRFARKGREPPFHRENRRSRHSNPLKGFLSRILRQRTSLRLACVLATALRVPTHTAATVAARARPQGMGGGCLLGQAVPHKE
jgi:hypothetical protein